jgi:hypothetical protein
MLIWRAFLCRRSSTACAPWRHRPLLQLVQTPMAGPHWVRGWPPRAPAGVLAASPAVEPPAREPPPSWPPAQRLRSPLPVPSPQPSPWRVVEGQRTHPSWVEGRSMTEAPSRARSDRRRMLSRGGRLVLAAPRVPRRPLPVYQYPAERHGHQGPLAPRRGEGPPPMVSVSIGGIRARRCRGRARG